jgi:histidinol-phosphate aminotransferase
MHISRRDLVRRASAGAALAAAVPWLVERAIAADPSGTRPDAGDGQLRYPIRLTSNGNPYGPSPRATAAMLAAVRATNVDPETECDLVRDRIAADHRVARDEVILAGGSIEILRMAVRAFVPTGKSLITAEPTFEMVAGYAKGIGRGVITVPLRPDYACDLDGMLSHCDSTTGLVYVCNPNNPTGSLTRRRDLEAFIARLPATTHVVIDEAYHHYVDDASDYRSFIDHPMGDSRVMITRSFSKIHGLAPLRIGYAVATAHTAARLASHRTSDGINVIASRAALAALADDEFVRASSFRNANDRQELFNQANARMVRWVDSQTNFVMLNAERPAEEVIAHFKSHRLLLPQPYPRFGNHVRVSLGTGAELQEFWRIWDLMPGAGHHKSAGIPAMQSST